MANIMVNDVCNLQCPYCFANKYVNGDTSTDITYSNFKKAVDWTNQSWHPDSGMMPPRIGIIGGEPTLHGQFLDLLNYVLMERRPGQEILVFTNALKMEPYVDFFARNHINTLVNLNSPEDIGRKNYNRTVSNIRQMRLKGAGVSIGVNFYKGDLDMKFAYDVIEEFAFDNLRLGITSPNTKEKICNGAFNYFNEIKEPIMQIMENCAEMGCAVHFDCQKIPACLWDDSRARLEKIAQKIDIDVYEHAGCTPVIDILTDLTAVRCFGISGKDVAVPIENFKSEDDIMGYFRTEIDNIGLLVPAADECKGCYHRHVGKCQGGCLTFKIDKINHITGAGPKKFDRT